MCLNVAATNWTSSRPSTRPTGFLARARKFACQDAGSSWPTSARGGAAPGQHLREQSKYTVRAWNAKTCEGNTARAPPPPPTERMKPARKPFVSRRLWWRSLSLPRRFPGAQSASRTLQLIHYEANTDTLLFCSSSSPARPPAQLAPFAVASLLRRDGQVVAPHANTTQPMRWEQKSGEAGGLAGAKVRVNLTRFSAQNFVGVAVGAPDHPGANVSRARNRRPPVLWSEPICELNGPTYARRE